MKLTSIVNSLESKTEMLDRQTHVLRVESDSIRNQLVAKETQLEEMKNDLLIANQRLAEYKADNSKQEKIDKLMAEVLYL